jgi:hypothetical protein
MLVKTVAIWLCVYVCHYTNGTDYFGNLIGRKQHQLLLELSSKNRTRQGLNTHS